MQPSQSGRGSLGCAVILGPLLILAAVFGGLFWSKSTTVVLIVRHAEKAPSPAADPPLTPAGQARAEELVHVAGAAGVQAIFATEFARTQQTVQPLAARANIPVTQVKAADVDGLVAQITGQHRGKVVLVAGHSNTIPTIVKKLGAGEIEAIPETEYDNLFVISIPRFGSPRVVRLRYGATN